MLPPISFCLYITGCSGESSRNLSDSRRRGSRRWRTNYRRAGVLQRQEARELLLPGSAIPGLTWKKPSRYILLPRHGSSRGSTLVRAVLIILVGVLYRLLRAIAFSPVASSSASLSSSSSSLKTERGTKTAIKCSTRYGEECRSRWDRGVHFLFRKTRLSCAGAIMNVNVIGDVCCSRDRLRR